MSGSRWIFTANSTTRMIASQKSGMAIPVLDPMVATRSLDVPGRVPAMIPAGSPMRMETTNPPRASDRVSGNRPAMPEATL